MMSVSLGPYMHKYVHVNVINFDLVELILTYTVIQGILVFHQRRRFRQEMDFERKTVMKREDKIER